MVALPTLADVLTDNEEARAWERIDSDEQRKVVEQELSQLDQRQRETLLANVLDGFGTAEIAMIQDRDEREVVADIRTAREALRKCVVGRGEYCRKLLPLSALHPFALRPA